MATFKVIDIIDGNTIKVSSWKWREYSGKRVRIVGYNIPDRDVYPTYAKDKLKTILEGKTIELKGVIGVERPVPDKLNDDLIKCSVFLDEINIANYFRELDEIT